MSAVLDAQPLSAGSVTASTCVLASASAQPLSSPKIEQTFNGRIDEVLLVHDILSFRLLEPSRLGRFICTLQDSTLAASAPQAADYTSIVHGTITIIQSALVFSDMKWKLHVQKVQSEDSTKRTLLKCHDTRSKATYSS